MLCDEVLKKVPEAPSRNETRLLLRYIARACLTRFDLSLLPEGARDFPPHGYLAHFTSVTSECRYPTILTSVTASHGADHTVIDLAEAQHW